MSIRDWFSRWWASKTAALPAAAVGWTDDMAIHVEPPHTLGDVVDFILSAEAGRVASAITRSKLMMEFGLTEDDAALAWDRTLGGLVRAAIGNPANCPGRDRDPIAWMSYQRCLREPELIGMIRPQYAAGKQGTD